LTNTYYIVMYIQMTAVESAVPPLLEQQLNAGERQVNESVFVRFPEGSPPLAGENQPDIFVLCGSPGAGKSTAGRGLEWFLAAELGREVEMLDVDEVRKDVIAQMIGSGALAGGSNPFAVNIIGVTYAEMDHRLVEAVRSGRSVVYAGNPLTQDQRDKGKYLADQGLHANTVTLWVDTPQTIADERALDPNDDTRIYAGQLEREKLKSHHDNFIRPTDTSEPYGRLIGPNFTYEDVKTVRNPSQLIVTQAASLGDQSSYVFQPVI
jgi:predicted kinase